MRNNKDLQISTFEKIILIAMLLVFALLTLTYIISYSLYTFNILNSTLLINVIIMSYCIGFTLGIVNILFLIYIIIRNRVSTND